MKVLFDTDIGTDIDDAVCLAYLLAKPECELVGITTVTAEPVKRASMASALCKVAGRDIPIYPGAAEPLLIEQRQTTARQAEALAHWPHETRFPEGQALAFMRDTIVRNPGEIVLLTIGPLTNAALLLAMEPELAGLLKAHVLMAGVFTNRIAGAEPVEWNVLCDPEAAAICYRRTAPVHRSIGLDVTKQVTMKAAEVRKRFQAPLLRPVLDFAEVWFQNADRIVFHDPLAGACLFDDGICHFERGRVDVELLSPRVRGMTHWTRTDEGPHEVALGVDAERFFNEFFSVFQ